MFVKFIFLFICSHVSFRFIEFGVNVILSLLQLLAVARKNGLVSFFFDLWILNNIQYPVFVSVFFFCLPLKICFLNLVYCTLYL